MCQRVSGQLVEEWRRREEEREKKEDDRAQRESGRFETFL